MKGNVQKKFTWSRRKYLLLIPLFLTTVGFSVYASVDGLHAPNPKPIEITLDPNIGIKAYVHEFLTANDAEALLPIIRCESQFEHFEDDGTPLKNREGSSAIGVAQILTSAHPDPKVLNVFNKRFNTDLTVHDFDITSLDGNLGYALVLYKVRGTQDWECAHII